ncbi:hypothetical protein, partial [Clavibacter michiganensis]|uniref:hypothetical protein n=1 Tax=Clavibacter michiganensis TaxID=28447 RepID=UPI00292CA5EA
VHGADDGAGTDGALADGGPVQRDDLPEPAEAARHTEIALEGEFAPPAVLPGDLGTGADTGDVADPDDVDAAGREAA